MCVCVCVKNALNDTQAVLLTGLLSLRLFYINSFHLKMPTNEYKVPWNIRNLHEVWQGLGSYLASK